MDGVSGGGIGGSGELAVFVMLPVFVLIVVAGGLVMMDSIVVVLCVGGEERDSCFTLYVTLLTYAEGNWCLRSHKCISLLNG